MSLKTGLFSSASPLSIAIATENFAAGVKILGFCQLGLAFYIIECKADLLASNGPDLAT